MEVWIPILVSVITGLFGLAGSLFALKQQGNKIMTELDKKHDLLENTVKLEIKHLSEKVERHNSVVDRTYKLETETHRQADELKRLSERLRIVEDKK